MTVHYIADTLVLPYVEPTLLTNMSLERMQGSNESPLSGQLQVAERNAWMWNIGYRYVNLSDIDRAAMHSFMSRCRGQYKHVMVPDFSQPTPVGSWTFYDMHFSGHPDFNDLDASKWTDENAACEAIYEPHGLRLAQRITQNDSSCIMYTTAGVQLPASDSLTLRLSVRGVISSWSLIGSLSMVIGINPGSANILEFQIKSEGYYTMPLDTHVQSLNYIGFYMGTNSKGRGDGVIIDRLDIFKGAVAGQWKHRNSILLTDVPNPGNRNLLLSGSRVELLGNMQVIGNTLVRNAGGTALAMVEPSVPTSFTTADSFQMCPFLPHTKARLQSPRGYSFATNSNLYDDFTVEFMSDPHL